MLAWLLTSDHVSDYLWVQPLNNWWQGGLFQILCIMSIKCVLKILGVPCFGFWKIWGSTLRLINQTLWEKDTGICIFINAWASLMEVLGQLGHEVPHPLAVLFFKKPNSSMVTMKGQGMREIYLKLVEFWLFHLPGKKFTYFIWFWGKWGNMNKS